MELEYAFFAAQSQGNETAGGEPVGRGRFEGIHQSVALLCIDFDDTLTEGDTTSLLKTVSAQVGGLTYREALKIGSYIITYRFWSEKSLYTPLGLFLRPAFCLLFSVDLV